MGRRAVGEVEAFASAATPQLVLRTLLFTDLVDSTRLVERLGDERSVEVSVRHDRVARDLMARFGGREIDKSDGFLLLFDRPEDGLSYALAYHEALQELSKALGVQLRARAGLHQGEVFLRENPPVDVARGAKPLEVEGIAKPTTGRLMTLARGKQTLLTRAAFDEARRASVGGELSRGDLTWLAHGSYRFKGVEEMLEVFEVGVVGVAPLKEPPDSEKVRRAVLPGDEITLGWRPAPGQEIPERPGWTLVRKVGEGGFGEVWLGRRQDGGTRVFKFCFEAERLRALQREVTILRLLKEALGDREDIVRVLGWSFDQAPYFVEMEYAEGGSLVEWAEAQGGLAQVPLATRLELVAQVAEALAAAHSVGVLHKDVKPQNVVVANGPEGAPRARLTDFGIGRVTNEKALIERGITILGLTELRSDGASSSRGTQLYMAPELLEGKPETIQADIFALGVLLYQVVAGDFSHALATGWRRDVGDDLLAEDIACFVDGRPERRPGNALEVAERLRTLEARRAQAEAQSRAIREAEEARQALERSHRRRRQLTVIAAVAVVVLAVVSVLALRAVQERRKAERAQEIADRRRVQAEDLIGFMVGDLRDKLKPLGKLDILDDVGGKAMRYFAAVPEEELSDEELLKRSKVLSQIGSIRIDQGKLAEALPPLHESLALARTLAERAPEDVNRAFELGQSLFWVGNTHYLRGDQPGALVYFQEYLAVSERLVARNPANKDWQLELAYSHSNIGSVLEERGDLQGALREYRATLATKERLARQEPGETSWKGDLARTHNSIAKVFVRLGEVESAQREFATELALKQEAVAAEPSNTEWQRDLALTYNYIGEILETRGDLEGSRASLGRAIAILRELVARDPTNIRWRCDLAINRIMAGHLLLERGEMERSLKEIAGAAREIEAVAAADPANVKWQRELARWRAVQGEALLANGDLEGAAREAQRATDIARGLLLKNQDDHARQSLGMSHLLLGNVWQRKRQTAKSNAEWQNAVEVMMPLAARSWKRGVLAPLTEALLHLGRIEEARPFAERLLADGYRGRAFLEACHHAGLDARVPATTR